MGGEEKRKKSPTSPISNTLQNYDTLSTQEIDTDTVQFTDITHF